MGKRTFAYSLSYGVLGNLDFLSTKSAPCWVSERRKLPHAPKAKRLLRTTSKISGRKWPIWRNLSASWQKRLPAVRAAEFGSALC